MREVICLSKCHKCRNFKRKNPNLKVIELKNSIEGLGDLISIVTYYLHIPHCSGCEGRRKILNKYFPLNKLIPKRFRYPLDNLNIRLLLKKLNVKKFPVILDKETNTVEYPS